MNFGALRRLPIWTLTVSAAAVSALAYFLAMRLAEEALGGVINGVGVLLTLASVLIPVSLVAS
jgi:hypothetical protein